ncbi:MAG: acyl-CoA/acyl-ACP dehydrogenase [Chloroflexi bacterium]|nr:acyl-CoA/acyl-ACP dehydrogenase [Chloroflexota bacterium]
MDFEFTEEQKIIRDTIQRLVVKQIEPLLKEYPPDRALPKEACLRIVRLVKPLGVLAARLPAEEGGSGLGNVGAGIIAEAVPYEALSPVSATQVVCLRVSLGGNDALKKRIIPPLLAGEKLGATANTEPDVGSDPRAIATKATPDGNEYVINGTKIWSSNGSVSDILLVVASLGKDQQGRNLITPLVVERDVSPYEATEIAIMGVKQAHLSEISLRDCRVPRENLLSGAVGHAHRILTASWISQRPLFGLCCVRVARKAFETSVSYAKDRRQFGKPIASFQLIQSMLAEMDTMVEASRLLCYRALSLVDKGEWCSRESSMAKYFAAESALKVTSMAVEIHGAYGISQEFLVEKLYRDARVIAFADGTSEIQKLIVGREITGIRAFT